MKKKFIIILLVLCITLYVSQNFYQFNIIQGDSMYPTYKNMQFTIINKRVSNFQCNDVIVFYCPAYDCIMVKRIIAVPNQVILISEGTVFVDGKQSPYVNQPVEFSGTATSKLFVDENQFFVMGDNYELSKDSRYEEIGCINRINIIGRLIPNVNVKPCAYP